MARFTKLENVPAWRAMATQAWDAPRDPTVYGLLELDARPLVAYVDALRERTSEKVTLTHVVAKAVATAIAERPEVNCVLRRGVLHRRDTIDVFFQVAFDDGEGLAGCKVSDVEGKSVVEVAADLRRASERIRARRDHPTQRTAASMARLPPTLVRLAMRAGEILSYDYGLNLSKLGVPYDAFGSVMITNVSSFGLTAGYAPLFPPSRTPIILTLGAVHDAPAVEDGRVVVRPTLSVGVSFDHRVLDGFQAGRMAKRFREVLAAPSAELGLPAPTAPVAGPAAGDRVSASK